MGPISGAAEITAGFFARERTIANARFNRWLVLPAAPAIRIGMGYGFSFAISVSGQRPTSTS